MEEKAWAEFWAGGGKGEEAIGPAHRAALADRWREFFLSMPQSGATEVIADIAAGSGAALKNAQAALGKTKSSLIALDTSPSAAAAAATSIPGAIGVVANAASLPFADRTVSIVISQFGLEYAGAEAFREAARVLAAGGHFCSIAHYRDGAIDRECAENERLLREYFSIRVAKAARTALEKTFKRRRRFAAQLWDDKAEGRFKSEGEAAIRLVDAAPPSSAKRTLQRYLDDMFKLSARRLAYDEPDAMAWIEGMEESLASYLRRMQSMRAAALDAAAIQDIASIFARLDVEGFDASPIILVQGQLPAAWKILARRH